MRKKRILITTEVFIHGGLETHIKGGVKALREMGHEVFLAIGESYEEDFLPKSTVNHLYKDVFSPKHTGHDILASAEKLREIIQTNRIDMVYAHPFNSILPSFLAAQKEGVFFSVTLHGPLSLDNPYFSPFYNKTTQAIYRAADTVIAVSQEVADLASLQHILTVVIPNAIDLRLQQGGLAASHNAIGSQSRWLLVSRLDEQKTVGLKDLITKVVDQKLGLITIAGEGSARADLKAWADSQGYGKKVHFLGKRDDVQMLMSEYDVVGGMGRVVLEALAASRRVVLVGYEGIHGVVDNNNFLKQAAYANFSGRNLPVIAVSELKRQLTKASPRHKITSSVLHDMFDELLNWRKMVYTTSRAQHKKIAKKLAKIIEDALLANDRHAPWYASGDLEALILPQIDELLSTDCVVSSGVYKKAKKYIQERSGMLSMIAKKIKAVFYPQLTAEQLIQEAERYFDKDYYLASYRDVKKSKLDPRAHYREFGYIENRSPGPGFNCELFLMHHPEFATAHEPLVWIYIRGLREGRFGQGEFGEVSLASHIETIKNDFIEEAQQSKKIIYMPSMSWYDPLQQRPHHLARRFAENGVVVVYADSMLTIPRKVQDNLYLVPQEDNTWQEWLKGCKDVTKYFWLFSTSGIRFNELTRLKSKGLRLIYDYIDDIHEAISGDITRQKEVFTRLVELDPAILMASAQKLFDQLKAKFPEREILMVKNAVNLEDFPLVVSGDEDSGSVPDDLRSVLDKKKGLVGYYGAMAPWLDYDAINAITELRADLEFVFIGSDYGGALKNLILRDNVHFLGPKEYKKLHNYSRWFDCAVIPFKAGDIAQSTSPVKLFEYMAMGVPVVCTRDLLECSGYPYVYMSADEAEFNSNIDQAIAAKKQQKTQKALIGSANDNTWSARARSVAEVL
jgi:glycosyltransferase involved in cell wall biosynthesis